MKDSVDWAQRAKQGLLGSGIDPADRKGRKNYYIDLLQKAALEEVLALKGDEFVLDFGCGSGRFSYWIAPKVRKVVGLEITPEMIDLAEENRCADNVEFKVYDGIHVPAFSFPFDLVLSVGVLQIFRGELLRSTVSNLTQHLRRDGRLCAIEQASDNSNVQRPGVDEYLQAFKESGVECLQEYPIRNGRWWMLYLIRYGVIPKKWLRRIARYELDKRRSEKGAIHYYKDILFVLRKAS